MGKIELYKKSALKQVEEKYLSASPLIREKYQELYEAIYKGSFNSEPLPRGLKMSDLSYKDRIRKGPSLRAYMIPIDLLTWGRYSWWMDIMMDTRKLNEDSKIPEIKFLSSPDKETKDMLLNCIDMPSYDQQTLIYYLIDFLGAWSGTEPMEYIDGIPEAVVEHFYKNFVAELLILHPYDYFGDILSELNHGKANAFFPTPMNVVVMMSKMMFGTSPNIFKIVNDPCVGTGRFLMVASNYCLQVTGQDINASCVKCSRLNLGFYAPWAVTAEDAVWDRLKLLRDIA